MKLKNLTSLESLKETLEHKNENESEIDKILYSKFVELKNFTSLESLKDILEHKNENEIYKILYSKLVELDKNKISFMNVKTTYDGEIFRSIGYRNIKHPVKFGGIAITQDNLEILVAHNGKINNTFIKYGELKYNDIDGYIYDTIKDSDRPVWEISELSILLRFQQSIEIGNDGKKIGLLIMENN